MNETTNSRSTSLDDPIVSVIIPIYNAEKTLRRTVDSILKQTFHDFELILVNDGSNDGSLSICYLYASKDVRIKVVNHKNMGLSLARSSGIKASIGHYILFVEADDWIEPDTLEALYGEAKKTDADMVICDYFEHLDNAVKEMKQRPNYFSADNVLGEIIRGEMGGVMWNKLIRRSIFQQFHVQFPADIILLEDMYINAQLLLHPLKLAYVDKALYHYDRTANPNSITMSKKPNFNKTANGLVTLFRELFVNTKFWPLWVEHQLPWISYLCLYYQSFSSIKYQKEFHYLIDYKVTGVNRFVLLGLNHYRLAIIAIRLRKMIGRLLH